MATGARYEITRVELHKLMTKFKKFSIFKICPKSTLSLLASRYDMPIKRCIPIGSMKKQHDAILESFGTTEEIIYSLTRLPSTTCSLVSSSPLLLNFENFSSLAFLDLRKYSKSNFDLAAKSLSAKIF